MNNAFTKSPVPKAPLHLEVNAAYKSWWKNKIGELLNGDNYVKVQHAVRGYPELLRLLQLFIDASLSDISFWSTTHEPCRYKLPEHVFGQTIYLLWQFDYFAIGCDSEVIAEKV